VNDPAETEQSAGRAWPRRPRANRLKNPVPLVLAVPALIALFATHFIPQLAGSWYAFTDWNGFSAHANWVGLRNFRELLHDPTTRGALWHTLELSFAFVVIVNLTGLGFALGLNRTLKSRHVLRALLFAPVVVSPLAIAFIWQYIFDYYGALNRVLRDVGLSSWQQSWLGDPQWALWTVLVVMVWQFTGLTMIVYLAGLQTIPDELYEAAAVDGARHRARFRRITLPLLAPAVTVNVTLMTIFGLRVFDQVLALTGGGPVDASETLATQVWKQTFVLGKYGYGASLALVLSALVMAITIVQLVVLRRRERIA
jgi:raffinose/stachyose/melibiose transport system permease protein